MVTRGVSTFSSGYICALFQPVAGESDVEYNPVDDSHPESNVDDEEDEMSDASEVEVKKRKSCKEKKGCKDVEAVRQQSMASDTFSTRAFDKRKAVPEETGPGTCVSFLPISFLSLSLSI